MVSIRTLSLALLALLVTAGPAAAGDGRFGTGQRTPVGYPLSLTVADFDFDGHADVAAMNYDEGFISVLLSKAGGGFTEAPHVKVGSHPTQVVAGDFNADGKQDLAASDDDAKTVSVRLGKGDGTFDDAPDITVTRPAIALVVGDFNADGRDDLAISDYTPVDPHVSVRLSAGDGTFTDGGSVAVDAVSLAVGDFNADGNEDVVYGGHLGTSNGVLQGGADGKLSQGPAIALPGAATGTLSW